MWIRIVLQIIQLLGVQRLHLIYYVFCRKFEISNMLNEMLRYKLLSSLVVQRSHISEKMTQLLKHIGDIGSFWMVQNLIFLYEEVGMKVNVSVAVNMQRSNYKYGVVWNKGIRIMNFCYEHSVGNECTLWSS